jgi:hypothetical protein
LASEDTILHHHFLGAVLYLVIERSDGIFLEKIALNDDLSKDDIGEVVHLDRREELTGVYAAGTGLTTWTTVGTTALSPVVVLGAGFGTPGKAPTLSYPTGTTITAVGDYSADTAWVGLNYEQLYEFSEQFHRPDGETPDLNGRLQIRRMNVRYVNSGYFQAEVTADGTRTVQTYKFTGNVVGQITLGALTVYTGTFSWPVLARSSLVDIELKNNTWKACTWLSAEWLGTFSNQPVIQ